MRVEFSTAKSPVIEAFMRCDARLRVIMGPFGSGKSSACVVEIQRRSAMQKKGPNGKRESRWAVVRNTMPQLRDTTIKTWLSWFPDGSCGYMRETGKTFFIEYNDVKAEVIFRALDDAGDVRNLLSLELTGAYINECREIPREIVEGLKGRIDRFPARKDGGATWAGVFADTNPPEEGSYWWAIMEGYDPDDIALPKKSEWEVFKQPGGMLEVSDGRGGVTRVPNPNAENVDNLPPGYYEKLCDGSSDEFVKVYVLGKYGTSKQGKPVHPMFKEETHVAKDILLPNPYLTLVIAADFGLTPAMVLKQQTPRGQVLSLDEIVTENMGLDRAIKERLLPMLRSKYEGFNYFVTGDPAGSIRSQTDESTCVQVFKKNGLKRVRFASSNNPIYRTEATDHFLSRNTEVGPAFLISPHLTYYKNGLKGGYHYKVSKTGIKSPQPEKNLFSHICEAGQYGDMFFQRGASENDEQKRKNEAAAEVARMAARRGVYTRRA